MGRLFSIAGFLPFLLIAVCNAFVDLGHKITIQNVVFKTMDGEQQILMTAIVNALILIPFILLFSPSGFLADKFAKPKIIRASAWVALGLTLSITWCYQQGLFWPAFAMTFALAIQSAIYSPAKYGLIKEIVGKDALAEANGLVQAVTMVAILGGIVVFSFFFESLNADLSPDTPAETYLQNSTALGWLLVAGTLVELVLSYRLKPSPAKAPTEQFSVPRYLRGNYLSTNLKSVYGNPVIWLCIIGLTVWWGISQSMLAAYPAYIKETFGETNTLVIQGTLAFAGLGIMLGSILAARLSRGYIETGLIPIGALGVSLGLSWLPDLNALWLHAANFFLIGLCGALFIVPLNALIQFNSRGESLGRVIAASNFVQNIGMLSFLAATIAVAYLNLSSSLFFVALSVVAALGAIYCVYKLPQSLVRLSLSILVSQGLRVKVSGLRQMPETGGTLLLSSHISWIDWGVIQLASPRPVRFVMEKSIYEKRWLRWFLDLFNVIPVASGASRQALEAITESLNKGEVICLFPEGAISRNGQLGEFKRGFERAARDCLDEVVIVPCYLRGLWGSRLSRAQNKLKMNRRATGLKRDVICAFGEPMSIRSTAADVKQAITELSYASWAEYASQLDPIPTAWLKTAKSQPRNTAVADAKGDSLSNLKFITAVWLFTRRMKKHRKEQNIGLLIPTSSGAAIANMAALCAGKTVVNINFTTAVPAVQASLDKAKVATVYSSRRFVKKLTAKGVDAEGLIAGRQVIYLEDIAEQIGKAERLVTLALSALLPTSLLHFLMVNKRHEGIDATAAILFSSGSTGTPKGVCLSHRNFMANLRQIADVLNTQDEDVYCSILPSFHAFGLTVGVFMPLIEGIPMVCHPDPTDALNIAKGIARYKATILAGTNTFFRLYVRNRKVHPLMLQSLRVVVAGAEKVTDDVRNDFLAKFSLELLEGYGLTETCPVMSVNLPDHIDTRYWNTQLGHKHGTVGMALPGSAFRIVDPESLTPLPLGEDGLILAAGPQIMQGYLDEPEMTAEVIREIDGQHWYLTGDIGHLDNDGFLSITDRLSRFAKIGGEMVSMGATESSIRPFVNHETNNLVAVNLPCSKKGEQVVLLIDGKVDIELLRKDLIDSDLAPIMVPSKIFSVSEVPILGSGKIDFKGASTLATQCLAEN